MLKPKSKASGVRLTAPEQRKLERILLREVRVILKKMQTDPYAESDMRSVDFESDMDELIQNIADRLQVASPALCRLLHKKLDEDDRRAGLEVPCHPQGNA